MLESGVFSFKARLTGGFMEHITSRENPRIKRILRLLSDRGERNDSNLFVAEGARLCLDALSSEVPVREVYLTEKALEKRPELLKIAETAHEAFTITEAVASKISDTKSTQGIFVVCEQCRHERPKSHADNARYLILSSLQDPGNVGTIIRTAEAFGLDGIGMSADCPEIYSPKVLRASMGGVFRLTVWTITDMLSELKWLNDEGVAVYAAALGGDSEKLGGMRFDTASAVVLGNEGAGLSGEIIDACKASVTIPMSGRADSLSVATAAGIIAWEMRK